jgi:hypothetical protein
MRLTGEVDLTPLIDAGLLLASRKRRAIAKISSRCRNACPEEKERRGEIETEKKRGDVGAPSSDDPQGIIDQIIQKWNKIVGVVPVRRLEQGHGVHKRVTARLKEHSELQWWIELFETVSLSKFLTGRKTGSRGPFHATLDWVLAPENLAKVLQGNYADQESNGTNNTSSGYGRFIEEEGERNDIDADSIEEMAE